MAEHKWTLAIVLAGVLVRWGWTAATTAGAGEVKGDAVFYHESALSLARRGTLADASGYKAWRTPLYPVFLAAVYAPAGPSVPAAQAGQVILGGLTCGLIHWGAGAWLPPGAALFAGWAAVFYYGLVHPCGRLLTECLFAFGLALLLAAYLRWKGGRSLTALIALSSAALYLTRPEGALAGLAVALSAPALKPGWTKRHSAAVLACLAAAVLAWSLRNQSALGRFLPGTTGASFSFWAALPRTMHERLGWEGGWLPPEIPAGELERSDFFQREALSSVSAAPRLLLAKALAFNLFTAYYPFLPRYELTYGLLVPLWLYGLWLCRSRRELLPAAILLAAWSAVYMVFGGADSRFRSGFAPILLWLAADAFAALQESWTPPAFRRAAAGWAAANLAAFALSPWLRSAALALRDLLWQPR